MDQIRNQFEAFVKLTDQDWQIFSSRLKRVEVPRKTVLLEKGKIEQHLSFIEKGIVRLYIPKLNNDLTFGFVFENSFVSAYDSFLAQAPSRYRVETITETILWQLTYNDLQAIYRDSDVGNAIGRHASEDLFLKKTDRELSLLVDSAEERYLKLFSERPEVLQKIPLKYIASYIGVTPQALSRIRKRIS